MNCRLHGFIKNLKSLLRTQMMILLIFTFYLLLLAIPTQSISDDDLHGGLSGLHWSDWDGRQVCKPSSFYVPASEAEVVQLVQSVAKREGKLKVVGAGHSFSSIALGDNGETMMSLDRMRRVLEVTNETATVEAGIRLFEFNTILEEHGVALLNMGATAEQSIAGVISTGTHGTGVALGSMSTQVLSFRIVLASGTFFFAIREIGEK